MGLIFPAPGFLSLLGPSIQGFLCLQGPMDVPAIAPVHCSQGERMGAIQDPCCVAQGQHPAWARCWRGVCATQACSRPQEQGNTRAAGRVWRAVGPSLARYTSYGQNSASTGWSLTVQLRAMQKEKGFCTPSILSLSPKSYVLWGCSNSHPVSANVHPERQPSTLCLCSSSHCQDLEVGRRVF